MSAYHMYVNSTFLLTVYKDPLSIIENIFSEKLHILSIKKSWSIHWTFESKDPGLYVRINIWRWAEITR